MSSCETCKFRAKYDNNPKSVLGRIWKWHISWCPGWKSYTGSLSDEMRQARIKKYGLFSLCLSRVGDSSLCIGVWLSVIHF